MMSAINKLNEAERRRGMRHLQPSRF